MKLRLELEVRFETMNELEKEAHRNNTTVEAMLESDLEETFGSGPTLLETFLESVEEGK